MGPACECLYGAGAVSAVNHTGVFAQLASPRTFPPFTACTPPGAAAKIRELALALRASPDVSLLARAQYKIQEGWLSDDNVAHIEVIMTPGGGSTSIPPTPNKTYVTLSLGLMVSYVHSAYAARL